MPLGMRGIGGEEPVDPARAPIHDADAAELAASGRARLLVGAVGAGYGIAEPVERPVVLFRGCAAGHEPTP